MGQYFVIVNPAKRQYVSASTFEESPKEHNVLMAMHGRAVALLVSNVENIHRETQILAGTWFGDRVFVAGDEEEPLNSHGLATASTEDPDRNLYFLACEEYENISHSAIAMLCEWSDSITEEFVQRCVDGWPGMLVCLGNVVFTVGSLHLSHELERRLGNDWVQQYKAAWLNYRIRPVEAIEQWKFAPEEVKEWVKKKIK